MRQLALALAPPPEPTFDSFFVARNAAPFEVLRQAASRGARGDQGPPDGERFIYLWGERGTGKSHLLRAFVAEATAHGSAARYFVAGEGIDAEDGDILAAVDDVNDLDMVRQLALFDLYNRIRTRCGLLISAGSRPPSDLLLREDLRTRLGAGIVMRLEPLTDEEKAAAISEHGRRRGLDLPPDLIEYLLSHVARDMGTQMAVIDTLDRVSLERKRALTLPLLRDVLRLLQDTSGVRPWGTLSPSSDAAHAKPNETRQD